MDLIQALKQKQDELKLTNEQFANRLGITRANWEWALKGKFNPGSRFLAGIVQNFPELKELTMQYLDNYLLDSKAS